MRFFQSSTHKALTAATLLGIILIVTHIVVPTARAEARAFSKGRTQPDLISHLHKHLHKSKHTASRHDFAKNQKKHKADVRNKHKKNCRPLASDFVCPSESVHESVARVEELGALAEARPINSRETVIHYANQPPPRLPQNEKIKLLI